ncbi:hypothetical protein B0H63DRAFT_527797 [Podospora didyma]|uniref:Uncharacterized protein n=1 Tax=Podospora didyma TaxID=330526 RepID=A0AAE0K4Q1_9PEZI|nr:hypothetical protein B0H63DRAFT_527797 [Podospora didyma]
MGLAIEDEYPGSKGPPPLWLGAAVLLLVSAARLNGATTETITAWFEYLALPAISLIKPENRWNKDETGILEGQSSNGLVLGSSEYNAMIKSSLDHATGPPSWNVSQPQASPYRR